MDDSDFGGVYTYGDIWMSETLYLHEQLSKWIHDIANKYPTIFLVFCYAIFPIMTFLVGMAFISYLGFYMNIHRILHVPNEMFIAIGLNIVSILDLILMACYVISIYELAWKGET
jgi:hypothetical protein